MTQGNKPAAPKALELIAGMDTVKLDPSTVYPVSYARDELHAALFSSTNAEGRKHLKSAREYVEQALNALTPEG